MTNTVRVDLHLHSTASDGVFSPSEVVFLAARHRVDVLALTDHDTTNGLDAARTAAAETKLALIHGVELGTVIDDAEREDGREVHMLGYGFDPDHPALQAMLHTLQTARLERAAQMVEKLGALGAPITLEDVLAIAGSGAVGRPHVAEALLRAGHVTTAKEAFIRFIGDDGPAYAPRYRLTPTDAIALLHDAGGVAVLAHPVYVPDYAALIPALAAHGLDGVEVYYPEHDPDLKRRLRVLARKHDLITTGGTDFHRPEGYSRNQKPNHPGAERVPPACVEQLRARIARYR